MWVFIALAAVIAGIAVWYFFFNEPPVEKPKEPTPPGSPTPDWIPEVFPLNTGMFGPKIKALQTALAISADGKFGNQTKAAVIAAGYAVPLSQPDYDKILKAKDTTNPIGKTAYSKYAGTKVYKISDKSVYKTAGQDEYIGTIAGEYAKDSSYWNIGNLYFVYKTSTYFK